MHNYLNTVPENVEFVTPEPTIENPVIVENYPYGFRFRTQARYYIETKKGHGQRVVFQTKNPKTGKWNKPKAGTYNAIAVLYRNPDNGHVENTGFDIGYADADDLAAFLKRFPEEKLTEFQRGYIRFSRAVIETRKHLPPIVIKTRTYVPSDETEEERTKRLAEEAKEEEEEKKQAAKMKEYLRKILAINIKAQEGTLTTEEKAIYEQAKKEGNENQAKKDTAKNQPTQA